MRIIVHVDMDAFYAAVEERFNPALRNLPVVVGADPKEGKGRGVVTTANYKAREFGIRSALPISRAWHLAEAARRRGAPATVFIQPNMRVYREVSGRIMQILQRFSDAFEEASIDEAYLDVSSLEGFAAAADQMTRLKVAIREREGLSCSVGIGPNKLIAKIASDFQKPDGLTVVPPGKVQAFLDPLPVRRLHGVGPATEKALAELGVQTVADLRQQEAEELTARFGKHGRVLYEFARGIDDRPVETHSERKSLGTENTYAVDLRKLEAMEEELVRMGAEVADGLFRRGLAACTVTLKVRYSDFTTLTRSRTFQLPVHDSAAIGGAARDLLKKTDAASRPVRLLGVTASNLIQTRMVQLPLFP